jgi:hypothetical protein
MSDQEVCTLPTKLRQLIGDDVEKWPVFIKCADADCPIHGPEEDAGVPGLSPERLKWWAEYLVSEMGFTAPEFMVEKMTIRLEDLVNEILEPLAPSPTPEKKPGCYDCGLAYGEAFGFADLMVPNAVWAEICGPGFDGALCPNCLGRRCVAAGIQTEARWMSGPFSSEPDPQRDLAFIDGIEEYGDLDGNAKTAPSPTPEQENTLSIENPTSVSDEVEDNE